MGNKNNKLSYLDPQESLRVDRYFSFQIDVFRKYKDHQLLKDLIVYMSLNHQKNLFGYVDLDLDDFCLKMKHSRANLMRIVEDPVFYKLNSNLTKEEHDELEKENGEDSRFRVWKNRLENALLILQSERFYFPREVEVEDIKKITHSTFVYLKEVSILYRMKGKAKKFYYQYKPTEEFEKTLQKYFLMVNLVNYLKVKSSNLTDLFFNILYRSQNESISENSVTFSIKYFADLMNVSTEKLNEPRGFSRVKDNIKRKFNSKFKPFLEKEVKGLSLDFIKGENARRANIPRVSWYKKNVEELEELKRVTYEDVFFTSLFKQLSVNYFDNYMSHQLDDEKVVVGFLQWIFSFKDYEVKVAKYKSCYADCYGNKDDVESDARNFFLDLKNIGEFQKREKFMGYDNGVFWYKINVIKRKPIEGNSKSLREFVLSVYDHFDVLSSYYENIPLGSKKENGGKNYKVPKSLKRLSKRN